MVHYTANNGDTAEGNGKYFSGADRNTSAHYFVDEIKIVRSVFDKDTAWHCGAKIYRHKKCRNENSIGVEMCSKKDSNGQYYINQKRLEYLEKTIKLIDIAGRIDDRLENNDAKEILKVIGSYSKALDLLDDYDHKTLLKPNGNNSNKKVRYEDCIDIINKLRFKEESDIFAIERNRGLEALIGNIYQTFDNNDVYQSIEEKAANFLYMIVKNHVFIDGNKRIAATLFIYFLQYYNILYRYNKQIIDNNTLVAITLLIAESNPNEKQILIDLIMNFLK